MVKNTKLKIIKEIQLTKTLWYWRHKCGRHLEKIKKYLNTITANSMTYRQRDIHHLILLTIHLQVDMGLKLPKCSLMLPVQNYGKTFTCIRGMGKL